MNRNKTLKISFSLKNTYRVNSILYGLRQIPLVKKAIPVSLYGIRGLKTFATILSLLWEVIATFAGKALYFFLMINGAASFYSTRSAEYDGKCTVAAAAAGCPVGDT